MLTLERAAELVKALREVDETAATDLFTHFDDVFKLNDVQYRNDGGKAICDFARMCGFWMLTNVEVICAN